jgi:hypothetical protein
MSEFADTSSEPIEGLEEPERIELELALFSQIAPNVWMGGCPVDSVPPETRFIVNLYPWADYATPEGITMTRSWLQDIHEMPNVDELIALACWVSAVRRIGPVLVHCQAGLNRSGLVTALSLMVDGATAGDAIGHLRACRHPMVLCNTTFESWLRLEAGAVLKNFFNG